DVARLAHALDPEGATAAATVHRTDERRAALACLACGAPVPAEAQWHCRHCGATLTAPDLAEAHRQVASLGPALQAHARRPAPHIVQQRLAAQSDGLERQRVRTAEMQAEADRRNGAVAERRLSSGDDGRSSRLPAWMWAVAAVLTVLMMWWW
ncbi:MAG: hypothetical protein Q7S90_02210, partial [Rubrivivax sp.]|nr:hypothetical protein [Rubrivivax sp.]